ncbi:MAG TPA: energy transducer TonB [Longimicrobiales bacterium]|nr:energy transducer TonB [Longimicrobiales bacterium]
MEHISTPETANDRFKRGFGDWFWYSVAGAAVLHLALFALFPNMTAADVSFRSDELTAIEIPDQIEIPPPPEQIARPATPVISDVAIDDDITIAPTTFDANPIENLPPPPSSSGGDADISRAPTFTPMTVRPELRNQSEVQRALVRNYPPLLRDAGIGGTPVVWFFIDEEGRVINTQLSKSSGHAALDEAAMNVAQVMRFSPALNRDRRVQVWVEIPIVFSAR